MNSHSRMAPPLSRLLGCALLLALGPGAIADDLVGLSDEFDDASTLSQWHRVYQEEGWGFDQLEAWDINTTRPGHMFMMPHTSSWFQEWRGVQAYKPVTGDFVVTTDVTPTRRGGGGPPNANFSLAGIFLRAPRAITNGQVDWTPQGENYIFLSMGAANNPGTYQFEVKSTQDSISQLAISAAPASRARIQIARVGSAFIALRQFHGGTWTVHRRYDRTDLPETLNVGLTTYTDWNTCSAVGFQYHNNNLLLQGVGLPGGVMARPDLEASFDYVRFERPVVPPFLEGLDLTEPGQVSDAALLAFLGDQANTPGGSRQPARILSPDYQPGVGLSMVLEVQTNRSYRLQCALTIPSTNWMTLTGFVSTQVLTPYLDESAGASPAKFYRLVSP